MYTRAQKESSSVSPTSIHKKSNSSDGERSFSVQRQPEINSSQEKERPSYSRNAADLLAANVMRSMAASEQGEEAQGHKGQEESGAASVAQVVMPKPELPIAPAASVSHPSGEMAIQRQCSECQGEEKDSDEMSSVTGVQAKLTVGAVGDKYEQEADRVAAQVMRMSIAPDNSPQVQRFGEEDNPVQRWSLAQSITPVVHRRVDEQVQMRSLVQRAFQAGGNEASGDLEGRLNASKGGGSALAPEVRAFMEPRFGADFSSVRVHTGGEAVQMNRELGAQAFAHGSDVYFGEGKSPGNNELTAHELTHVVQQTGGVQLQRQQNRSERRTNQRRTEQEIEGDRRRRRPRDRSRGRGGDFESDWAGRLILERYLTGGGDWNINNDPRWKAYMEANEDLRQQIRSKLVQIGADLCSKKGITENRISQSFSAELPNGEAITGYNYLHGTNSSVGGFAIRGDVRITRKQGACAVRFNLTYTWNDIIDSNPQYWTDQVKNAFAELITLGSARAYTIRISWSETNVMKFDRNGTFFAFKGGWPADP